MTLKRFFGRFGLISLISCFGSHLLAEEYPNIDGSNNNLSNSTLGTPDTHLKRIAPLAYSDGAEAMAGSDRPNPRDISNIVANQTIDLPEPRGLSGMISLWGQFLSHDISLTESAFPFEAFNVDVPVGDVFFDASNNGNKLLPFNRSDYDKSIEATTSTPRQQINEITTWIDGSVVYGSEQERADFLRTFKKGKLKTSEGNLLPFNETLPNQGPPTSITFIAGDVRANENVPLTAMHTIWVREHNRLARQIRRANDDLTDEAIYQKARALVTAQIQAITYNEWLPALLGPHSLAPYTGYDDSVDPTVSHAFSVAAFRVGHTMLSNLVLRLDAEGNPIPEGNLALASAFFAPERIIFEGGVAPVLRGAALQPSQTIDSFIINDVRNFLFGAPGFGGMDLVTFNIMRGRDHGLPDYNSVRVAFGLPEKANFADINSDNEVNGRLADVYESVDLVDPWVGMLSETSLPGASVGETIFTVFKDQFERLRDGDRFWYQRVFEDEELAWIETQTLAKVVRRNTDIKRGEIGQNVFFTP
jgi:hypothetical protein